MSEKLNELINTLDEKIIDTKEEIKENKEFPNSYCSGYDNGYLAALYFAKEIIEQIYNVKGEA